MFKFKGIKSSTMFVKCVDEDFKGKSARNYIETSAEGYDGSTIDLLGYQNYSSSLEIILFKPSMLDDVLAWLDGSGKFEYEGRITKAHFLESVSTENKFDRVIMIKTNFVRSPFWYNAYDPKVKVSNFIRNDGNVYAKPLIEMYGQENETVKLTINDISLSYTFDETKGVVIDCAELTETMNGISKSKNLKLDGYSYPILYPGINKVFIEGNADVYVTRKDAWL